MPTKTTARPRPRTTGTSAAGASRRFSRPGATTPPRASRIPSRPPAVKLRGRKKPAKPTGLAGLLTSLPMAGAAKGAKGGGGKAKPAFALLAAGAGAFLGRKQLKKRKEDDVVAPAPPAPEVYTAPAVDGGVETPLRPPAA